MFDYLFQILYGIIQGFTEIFPISSSGHLVVVSTLLGQKMSFQQIILLHLGTFFAILTSYRGEVINLVTGKLGWKVPALLSLCFGTTAVVGLIVKKTLIDPDPLRSQSVAILWMVNGLIIFVIGVVRGPGQRSISDLRLRDYLIIGVAQGIAALPGISRLGMTLVAGLAGGMKWSETVKLSFLLSLPTILAANLYELLDPVVAAQLGSQISIPFLNETAAPTLFSILDPGRIIIGLLSILITYGCGLLALNFLSKFVYVGRRLLVYFGIYCVVVGTFFLLYLNLLY